MIKLINEDPFVIFKMPNPLSVSESNDLRDLISRTQMTNLDTSGGKTSLPHGEKNSIAIINKSNALKNLLKFLSSQNTFYQISKLLKNDLDSDFNNYKIISSNPLINFLNFYLKKLKPIRLNVEFSVMPNGAYIPPHTDSRNKLITFLLYLPTKEQSNQKNLGTVFFNQSFEKRDRYKNFNNEPITKKFPAFYEHSEIIYSTDFNHHDLYGFIKNAYSWHGVEKLDLPDESDRISVNINFYKTNKTIFGGLTMKLKNFLKSLFRE